jgi:hypothetical protein
MQAPDAVQHRLKAVIVIGTPIYSLVVRNLSRLNEDIFKRGMPVAGSKKNKNIAVVFRGTMDVLPAQINHLFPGDGVFGSGTYFALNKATGDAYAFSEFTPYENFGIACEYEIPLSNIIEITEDDFEGLTDGMDLTITPVGKLRFKGLLPPKLDSTQFLSAIAKNWSGVILEISSDGIEPEGGRQLILPLNTDLEPVLVRFAVFGDRKLLNSLDCGKAIDSSISDIPAVRLHEVSEKIDQFLSKPRKPS